MAVKTTKKTKQAAYSVEMARELDAYVEKSWDINSQGGVTNEAWSTEVKAFIDAVTLKSLFFSEDWVYILCDLIAAKLSAQSIDVVHRETVAGKEVLTKIPDSPLRKLLEQPNAWQDYTSWMYNIVVELVLMGNCILWRAKRTGQLIPLSTEWVRMDFDQKNQVRSYMFHISVDSEGNPLPTDNQQTFAPSDIIHIRRPNPSSLLWGLSPFIPGRKSVLFNRYSADYLNAFYVKQAVPGMALTLDRNVNEDVALRQLRSFEVTYQGRKNMRRTLILPKGVDVKTLSHTISDQNLKELIDQNRETIIALLKVPPHEVGLQSTGSLGSEEYKIALRNFWDTTLIPCSKLIEGALTKFYQADLGENNYFKFDLSNVEALQDDLLKMAQLAIQMLQGGLSINEVRAAVWKKEPDSSEDASKPFVLVSSSSAAEPSFFSATPESAALPVPSNTKLAPSPRWQEARESSLKSLVSEEARNLTVMAGKALELLQGLTESAIDAVGGTKSLCSKSYKADDRKLRRAIERAMQDNWESSWENEVSRTLSSSVELGYDTVLNGVVNAKDRETVEVLRARDASGRRATLSARGLESFASISKTHTDRIMRQIAKGQERGESIGQIMRRVADTLGTPGELAGKAETIARTETLVAVSIGQNAAVQNAKEVIPGLKKAWITAGDDRVRDEHVALDGDVIDVDAKFANGLSYPRDPSGEAGSVINCRCTLIIIPPGEDLEIP